MRGAFGCRRIPTGIPPPEPPGERLNGPPTDGAFALIVVFVAAAVVCFSTEGSRSAVVFALWYT